MFCDFASQGNDGCGDGLKCATYMDVLKNEPTSDKCTPTNMCGTTTWSFDSNELLIQCDNGETAPATEGETVPSPALPYVPLPGAPGSPVLPEVAPEVAPEEVSPASRSTTVTPTE